MQRDDFPAFTEVLTRTAELFGEALSAGRIVTYYDALADLTLADVRAALRSAERTLRWFPKPVEIREALNGTPDDQAELAWARVLHALRQYGSYDSVDFADPVLHEAIRVLWGGWDQVSGRLQTAELGFTQAEFKKTYRALRARGGASLPTGGHLAGIIEIQNGAQFPEWVKPPRRIPERAGGAAVRALPTARPPREEARPHDPRPVQGVPSGDWLDSVRALGESDSRGS